MENSPTNKAETKAYTVPSGFLMDPIVKSQRMSGPRAISFDNDKQRNAQNLNKGLAKPGYISYDTLRRAARSVHIVRICITVLKEKVAKTKWIVRPKDPMADKEPMKVRIEEVSKLLKKPNRSGDTWRSFLDKSLEDLYVCDAVAWEKTRYPDGKIAELYQVDSTTIHPVFNEYGERNVLIPLATQEGEKELPVSYLQVLNYSQYGGPQSGDVIAAWPYEDMQYFHMHPQGSLEGFGFGLSPIESVLSVVSNLLNADNYNGTYFEEGSFPPVILQLMGQVNDRDLEAYREYLMAELMGNFHRPAIMAGQNKAEVINLKSLTNRDMEFMEYQKFLAKLMTAAYGLSAEDINLTDATGSKNVAENQTELSEGKGYTSTLQLIEEQVNAIIEDDFGYEDIEFAFVADDTLTETEINEIVDKRLKNGTMTLNEAREKFGDKPFGTWANEPVILTSEGSFNVIGPDSFMDPKEVEEEAQEKEDEKSDEKKPENKGGKEEVVKKSASPLVQSLYVSRDVKNAEDIIKWAKSQGLDRTVQPKDMHVTVAYSKAAVDWMRVNPRNDSMVLEGGSREVTVLGDALVLKFESADLDHRWKQLRDIGASWDYENYNPHVTITYDGKGIDLSKIEPYTGPIILARENVGEVNEDWVDGVKEKMVRKAVLTRYFRTWMDDFGYSQPFIYQNIATGEGWVIKPPVAVNLMSQEMEVQLSQRIAAKSVNVPPVVKKSFQEVVDMMPPEVFDQFNQYVILGEAYDSEKWKAKIGGSRKFSYYLVQPFIDGYKLNNPLLIADMKRDPDSYAGAARDLARLWKVEKAMVLGDRRIDQYLIDRQKRGWGFDFQFEGDRGRWENSSEALFKFFDQIPELKKIFDEETREEGPVAKAVRKVRERLAGRTAKK